MGNEFTGGVEIHQSLIAGPEWDDLVAAVVAAEEAEQIVQAEAERIAA